MDDHEADRVSPSEARSKQVTVSERVSADPHRLSGHTQKRIGLHLRAMYDTIVQQPVPDRFRDLIAQMDDSGDKTLDKVKS